MVRTTDLPQPIVAINVGSSGVRAIAADYDERHDIFHILGTEYSTYRHPCVEKGIMVNTSDVGFMINETWKKLCNRIGRGELKNTFVCVGGYTLQSVHVEAHRQQRRSEIRPKLLKEMQDECSAKIEAHSAEKAGVLSVIPERWEVDGDVYDASPVNVIGKDITLYATAFVMRKEYSTKITDAFQRSAMTIRHHELVPDACITALTLDEEREKGCAVIDMGAQTTTLTVYKNNQFHLTKVIPQGGQNISHDLESLGITANNAETLKVKWGTLSIKQQDLNKGIRIPSAREGEEPLIVTRMNICSIIACRMNEIMMPLLSDIEKIGDISIIYLTGGAAMLKGIVPFLSKKTSIPVKYATHAQYLANDTDDEFFKPLYGTLVGTLLLGQDYLNAHPNEKPKEPTFLGKIKENLTIMFGGEEN